MPDYGKKLDLNIAISDSYWIKGLYVSYILQGLGVGGAAMSIAEQMAMEEPLIARHLLLDTVQHDDQSDKDFAIAKYGGDFKVNTWY